MKSYTFEYIAFVLGIAIFGGVFAWLGSMELWLALAILAAFAIINIAFLLGRNAGRNEVNEKRLTTAGKLKVSQKDNTPTF